MKITITTLAIAILTLLAAAPQAEARSHHSSRTYISGYNSCGDPIYTERSFIGYDRCGNPLWRKRVIRPQYRPVTRPHYAESHCRPARYQRGYREGTLVIQAGFRN